MAQMACTARSREIFIYGRRCYCYHCLEQGHALSTEAHAAWMASRVCRVTYRYLPLWPLGSGLGAHRCIETNFYRSVLSMAALQL